MRFSESIHDLAPGILTGDIVTPLNPTYQRDAFTGYHVPMVGVVYHHGSHMHCVFVNQTVGVTRESFESLLPFQLYRMNLKSHWDFERQDLWDWATEHSDQRHLTIREKVAFARSDLPRRQRWLECRQLALVRMWHGQHPNLDPTLQALFREAKTRDAMNAALIASAVEPILLE